MVRLLAKFAGAESGVSMKKLIVAGVAVAALLSAPAFAADMPMKAPMAAPMFDWSGWYVGIEGGGGWARSKIVPPAAISPESGNGGLAGGTIGYNLQRGPWVLGIEGDFSWSNIHTTTRTNCATTCDSRLDWFGTARARAGYTVAPTLLLYATGGAAFGSIHSWFPTFPDQATARKTGWTIGGGIEGVVAPNWTAKLEYLHVNFGRYATDTLADIPNEGFRANIVRVGLNYKFDWGKGPVVAKY